MANATPVELPEDHSEPARASYDGLSLAAGVQDVRKLS